MINHFYNSFIGDRPIIAIKTGVCSKGDVNYQMVSNTAKETFVETLGFPTPAPENCMYIFVEIFTKKTLENVGNNRPKREIIAGLGLSKFESIPLGKSFVEKCLSEKIFKSLKDLSGKRVERNKCGYIGSLFINKKYKDKNFIFLLLLDKLVKTGEEQSLDFGVSIPTKIILKRLDHFKIPYLRLGRIDQKNGGMHQFQLSEKYKSGWDRWLNLGPEVLLINKNDIRMKLRTFKNKMIIKNENDIKLRVFKEQLKNKLLNIKHLKLGE